VTTPHAHDLSEYLDALLDAQGFPDYPGALNGLQLDHRGPVRRVAAAVDFSGRTIDAAISAGANFLILHHGMFWGGSQCITGQVYERLQRLIANDVAVYASHLPLDAHPVLGNNARIARALSLEPTTRFGTYADVSIGVAGESDIPTAELLERTAAFAQSFGGAARASWMADGRMTRRWAIVTGAGAGSKEIRDARARGIDTLIVGEGPHHTTVEAADAGVVIIYAGHYATETLGVCALADAVHDHFGLPASFLLLPTGS
jgi:dinuclear metal center YbgI/SA1388 family protein